MTNPLLLMRTEIVCLLILLYIRFNSKQYRLEKDEHVFSRLFHAALLHVLFDLITVYTVNHTELIPSWLNWSCHVIFYITALIFSYYVLVYVLQASGRRQKERTIKGFFKLLIALYIVALPALSIEYLQGNGTKYSMGTAAYLGYGIALILFLISFGILFYNKKNMASHVVNALFPALCTLVVIELIQVVVPEFLFTGAGITIVVIGMFFSLENPAYIMKKKALQDVATSFHNRNSFEEDRIVLEKQFQKCKEKKGKYGIVFCDINRLKEVNDTYGHMTGDEYISDIAGAMLKNMKRAERLYRFGGDEFIALYRDTEDAQIQKEIRDITAECERIDRSRPYSVSVAVGYAISDNTTSSLEELLRIADARMYEEKNRMNRKNSQ